MSDGVHRYLLVAPVSNTPLPLVTATPVKNRRTCAATLPTAGADAASAAAVDSSRLAAVPCHAPAELLLLQV